MTARGRLWMGPLLTLPITVAPIVVATAVWDVTAPTEVGQEMLSYSRSLEGLGDSVLFLGAALIAAAILHRHPQHGVGLSLWASWAVFFPILVALSVTAATIDPSGAVPAWKVTAALTAAGGESGLSIVLLIYPMLLFPDGQLPSRRWRPAVAITAVLALLTTAATVLQPGDLGPLASGELGVRNPLGWSVVEGWSEPLAGVTAGLMVGMVLAALVVRWRRSRGTERQQLKWVLTAAAVLAPTSIGWAYLEIVPGIVGTVTGLALLGAIAVAILRYRLYDIDIVISRTLTAAVLGAFIAAVYVALVVGVGSLVGGGDEPDLWLSIVATAVVAIAFQPVRRRVRSAANRLVFGPRATPYEVLAGFTRDAPSASDDAIVAEAARLLLDGTAATRVAIWRLEGAALVPLVVRPDSTTLAPLDVAAGDAVLAVPGATITEPIEADGELLGALTVESSTAEPLGDADRELTRHLAGGLGLVLRNLGLRVDLQARVEELAASRRRVVEAADTARRSVESQLERGAIAELATIEADVRALGQAVREDGGERSAEILDVAADDALEAVEAIRRFARGVYPPALEEDGLVAALRAAATSAGIPVTVHAPGLRRLPTELEIALYFTVLEALQNTTKYASADSAHVQLGVTGTEVLLEVSDDGVGFDPATVTRGAGLTNMADRIDALGGRLDVESDGGGGTRVRAQVPLRTEAATGAA